MSDEKNLLPDEEPFVILVLSVMTRIAWNLTMLRFCKAVSVSDIYRTFQNVN